MVLATFNVAKLLSDADYKFKDLFVSQQNDMAGQFTSGANYFLAVGREVEGINTVVCKVCQLSGLVTVERLRP